MQYPGMQCDTDAHLYYTFCLTPLSQCCNPEMQMAVVLNVRCELCLDAAAGSDCLACMLIPACYCEDEQPTSSGNHQDWAGP